MRLAGIGLLGLLVSVAACGSDDKDEMGEGPGPGALDGGLPDGSGPIVDMDATLRPDSTLATPDAATDGGDVIVGLDGAIVGGGTCADGFPRGTASSARRDVRQTMPTIEGVAVCPNGDVFVTAASLSQVWRVPFAGVGEPEVWYTQSTGLFAGLTCDDQGRLFAADFGFLEPGGVVQITAKGAGTPLPRPSDFATQGYNGVLVVQGTGIYGSDTLAGRIMLWRDVNGVLTAETAISGLQGPNGLARGTDGRLYAALTSTNPFIENEVVSFAIGTDGKLADRKSVWKGPNVVDGIAIDENDVVYVAFYNDGKIVRATDGATVATATNPASLAFRGGTLLYTDYDVVGSQQEKVTGTVSTTGHLWAVDLAVCGAP